MGPIGCGGIPIFDANVNGQAGIRECQSAAEKEAGKKRVPAYRAYKDGKDLVVEKSGVFIDDSTNVFRPRVTASRGEAVGAYKLSIIESFGADPKGGSSACAVLVVRVSEIKGVHWNVVWINKDNLSNVAFNEKVCCF